MAECVVDRPPILGIDRQTAFDGLTAPQNASAGLIVARIGHRPVHS
jgi:hypothetical protein